MQPGYQPSRAEDSWAAARAQAVADKEKEDRRAQHPRPVATPQHSQPASFTRPAPDPSGDPRPVRAASQRRLRRIQEKDAAEKLAEEQRAQQILAERRRHRTGAPRMFPWISPRLRRSC